MLYIVHRSDVPETARASSVYDSSPTHGNKAPWRRWAGLVSLQLEKLQEDMSNGPS